MIWVIEEWRRGLPAVIVTGAGEQILLSRLWEMGLLPVNGITASRIWAKFRT